MVGAEVVGAEAEGLLGEGDGVGVAALAQEVAQQKIVDAQLAVAATRLAVAAQDLHDEGFGFGVAAAAVQGLGQRELDGVDDVRLAALALRFEPLEAAEPALDRRCHVARPVEVAEEGDALHHQESVVGIHVGLDGLKVGVEEQAGELPYACCTGYAQPEEK